MPFYYTDNRDHALDVQAHEPGNPPVRRIFGKWVVEISETHKLPILNDKEGVVRDIEELT